MKASKFLDAQTAFTIKQGKSPPETPSCPPFAKIIGLRARERHTNNEKPCSLMGVSCVPLPCVQLCARPYNSLRSPGSRHSTHSSG